MVIGNAASEKEENIMLSEGTNDRDFSVGNSGKNIAVNESTANVKIWKGVLMKDLKGR